MVIVLPVLIVTFYRINKHYQLADQELSLSADIGVIENALKQQVHLKVILPISKLHKGTIAALEFARQISPDVTPVVIDINSDKTAKLQQM